MFNFELVGRGDKKLSDIQQQRASWLWLSPTYLSYHKRITLARVTSEKLASCCGKYPLTGHWEQQDGSAPELHRTEMVTQN